MRCEPSQCGRTPVSRFDSVSAVGLATLVAALHVAVLAGRLSSRLPRGRHVVLLVWEQPDAVQVETTQTAARVPSNPMQAFNAGRLALTYGVAVIVLAIQLQVMRMGAALGR